MLGLIHLGPQADRTLPSINTGLAPNIDTRLQIFWLNSKIYAIYIQD